MLLLECIFVLTAFSAVSLGLYFIRIVKREEAELCHYRVMRHKLVELDIRSDESQHYASSESSKLAA